MDKEESKMFYLHHQKLTLDIDMNSRVLLGFTELQIYFNTIEAQFIRLNVKKADILSVKVNGIKAKYDRYDPCYELCSSEELNKASPNCFHSFKKLFDLAQASGDHGELVILIPPEINLNMHLSPNVTNPSGLSPVPLLVQIEYLVSSPEIGVLFSSNGRETDVQKSSYFYTSNHLGPGDVRCWLPCLDDMHERCTWEMNFIVTQPETDLSKSKLSVIASGELIGQEVHPNDPNRMIYKYYVSFPCPAYLLSFAIGDFENIVFGEMEGYAPQTDTGDKLAFDMSKAVVAYCPKGWKHELKNSSEIVSKAMSFYINNFGSYPFDSFKLIFLETSHSPVSIGAEVAILGLNFLFSEDIIDQAYETRRAIGLALATQWFGVNVVPRLCSDIWLILGLSGFMSSLFLKSHFGINEYRYRLKMDMMRVCQLDSNRPPLCNALMTCPYDPQDVQFMNLKAPIVLYMINKQMVKSGKSHGLFRVIPEIIRATMSGEFGVGNSLSTHWFLRCCRKMSKVDFKSFAEQWIYGSGCPKFTFTYSFNRKKMVVEINMVQTTTNDGINQEDKPWLEIVRPTKYFTGYMTACICEADGTPYEHILDIQEPEKKFEVQFNTKYKRIRRNTKRFQLRKQAAAAAEAIVKDQLDVDNAEVDDLFLAEEGNEKEKEEWQIVEWGEDDEESLASATFEWIRMDSDFEWISEITLEQPDHMWAGQLEKDRDVVSQYEAVQALKNLPSAACSTTLLRTVMNSQCYYRVRGEAAHALIYCAKSRLNNIGLYHLLKIFHRKYCCNILNEGEELNRFVLKPNDFSNLSEYFVQKSIILALSQVRDDYNEAPSVVINLILELLKMNDNSSNSYSDNFYISSLIISVGFIIESKYSSHLSELDAVCTSLLDELKRYNTIDRVIPSYHNSITVSCIQVFTKLSLKRIIPLDLAFFLKYTRYAAFDAILLLGGLLHISIFDYVFNTISNDPEPQMRYYLIQKLNRIYALINLRLNDASQNEDHSDFIDQNYLDLLEEGGYIASNTPVLFPHDEKLRAVAWSKFHSPDIDLRVRNALFTLCKLIPGNSKRENLDFSAFKIRIPMEISESALNLDTHPNGVHESNGVQPHEEAPVQEIIEPDWSVYDIQDATFDPVIVEPPFNKPASIDDHKTKESAIAHPNGSKKLLDQSKDARSQSKPKERSNILEKKTKKDLKPHLSNTDIQKSSAEVTALSKKQDSKEESINVDIESIPLSEQNHIERHKPTPLRNTEDPVLNKQKKKPTLPSPTILSTDTPKSLPETVTHIDDTTKYLSDSGKVPKIKLSSSQHRPSTSRPTDPLDRRGRENKPQSSSQSRHSSIDHIKQESKRRHESSGDVLVDRHKSPKHHRDSLAHPTDYHKSSSKQRPESRSDLIDPHRSSSKQRPDSRSDTVDPNRISSKQRSENRSDSIDSHRPPSKQRPESRSDTIDAHKQSSKQRLQESADLSTHYKTPSKHRSDSHAERQKISSAHQHESSSSRTDTNRPKKSLIVKLILPKIDEPAHTSRHRNPPSEPSRPPSSHKETPDTPKKFKIKLKLN